jgi:hypothetical protein
MHVCKKENFTSGGRGGKLYMSFENEQYEYINEAYGSVELYAIYNVLICFIYTMPLPDTLIVYMCFYIFKIVFLS